MNEYLSSVRLSTEAFRDLTEHYAASDRRTVICMVGDHAPPFVSSLPEKNPNQSEEERQIALRTVPFIIWANFDTQLDRTSEWAAMVDLVPMVLRTAGLPLSTFYSEILSLSEALPVRVSNGIVRDRDGKTFVYPRDTGEWRDLMDRYCCMEYNSLLPEEEYREELFLSPEFD